MLMTTKQLHLLPPILCLAAIACSPVSKEIITDGAQSIWNERRLDTISDIYSASIADGIRKKVQAMQALYPDLVITIDDIAIDGHVAAIRWTSQGTHGSTGKPVETSGIAWWQLDGKKVVQEWNSWDTLSEHQQVGFTMLAPGEEIRLRRALKQAESKACPEEDAPETAAEVKL